MSVSAAVLGSALGVQVRSDLELARAEGSGLPLEAREGLLRMGLSPAEIARHIIPARAWTHRMHQRKQGLRSTFSAEESGRILRVLRLVFRASELFGDTPSALAWLRTPKIHLEGQTPLELAETEHGAGLVEQMLVGAEEGFAA